MSLTSVLLRVRQVKSHATIADANAKKIEIKFIACTATVFMTWICRETPICRAAEAFSNQAETESGAVIYDYDPEYVDRKYELLNLKVIHRRGRTGFEETKDFPIRVNDLVAGRYQVTHLPILCMCIPLNKHCECMATMMHLCESSSVVKQHCSRLFRVYAACNPCLVSRSTAVVNHVQYLLCYASLDNEEHPTEYTRTYHM